jgi:RHS repeat-associated protein
MRFEYADERMPVVMITAGVTYYLAYDQVGSLRAVADAAGNVVKLLTYDSFGNIIADTSAGFQIPFGFAGGLHDRDTGLVRFGYRDYDPDVGRWTAKDPIFFAGGDTDLYGYVLNDPVSRVDSYGLLNILGGVGGSAIAPLGAEGSGGIVINPGFGNDQADVGVFGSVGAGGGVNVSADLFVGFIRGDISNVSGVTANINIVAGPVSITGLINPKTGQFMGFTAGIGPSATPIGASGTLSITGTFTLRDLIKLIRELLNNGEGLALTPCH